MAEIFEVGVVGSGIMATGVAEVAARAGHEVIVRARTAAAAEAALAAIATSLDRQVAKGKLAADEREAIVGRLRCTDELARLAGCDLVIENVVEDLTVKRSLFAELDRVVKPGAILATNTSTLAVVELAMATGRPEAVAGIHFFNPAPAMPLVEVVRPITVADETIARAVDFAERCGKDVIVVEDRAGFVVNALLFPYLNSAVRMLEQGTAGMEAIDTAMRGGCGFPMGPFALLDLVGLDTSVSILEALYGEFRDPSYAPAPTLRRKVAAGQLGRKSGQGFYRYG